MFSLHHLLLRLYSKAVNRPLWCHW